MYAWLFGHHALFVILANCDSEAAGMCAELFEMSTSFMLPSMLLTCSGHYKAGLKGTIFLPSEADDRCKIDEAVHLDTHTHSENIENNLKE